MGAMTNALENKLIDHVFRATAYTAPATLYIGLFNTLPNDTGTGGTECTGTNYNRKPVTSGVGTWYSTNGTTSGASSGTNGTTSNVNAITFDAPGAGWGSITGVGIWDAVTAGTLLVYAALTQSKTVNNGDAAPSFASGALSFQIDTD